MNHHDVTDPDNITIDDDLVEPGTEEWFELFGYPDTDAPA